MMTQMPPTTSERYTDADELRWWTTWVAMVEFSLAKTIEEESN